jgi:hypothetical protein
MMRTQKQARGEPPVLLKRSYCERPGQTPGWQGGVPLGANWPVAKPTGPPWPLTPLELLLVLLA